MHGRRRLAGWRLGFQSPPTEISVSSITQCVMMYAWMCSESPQLPDWHDQQHANEASGFESPIPLVEAIEQFSENTVFANKNMC